MTNNRCDLVPFAARCSALTTLLIQEKFNSINEEGDVHVSTLRNRTMRVIGTQFPLMHCGTVLIWNLRSYSCEEAYNPRFRWNKWRSLVFVFVFLLINEKKNTRSER